MDSHGMLDPAKISRKAGLPTSFYPRFELIGFPDRKVFPIRAPDDSLRWYTRLLPLNGTLTGPETGHEFFAPYCHPVWSEGGHAHAIIRDATGLPVGDPVPLWVRMWNLDSTPVVTVYSLGHEEYYLSLLKDWNPAGVSEFSGLDGEQVKVTFHPQCPPIHHQ